MEFTLVQHTFWKKWNKMSLAIKYQIVLVHVRTIFQVATWRYKMDVEVVTCEPKEFFNENIHYSLLDSLNNSGIERVRTQKKIFRREISLSVKNFQVSDMYVHFCSFTTFPYFFIFLRKHKAWSITNNLSQYIFHSIISMMPSRINTFYNQ